MKKVVLLLVTLFFLFSDISSAKEKTVLLKFDSKKEVPGYKIALKNFCDTLPSNWTKYNYAVLELRCTTSQRVFVGFTTQTGYNELRIIFYATKGWIRCALPLSYFRDLPAGAFDLAATYNHKRPLSFINIEHGTRHPLIGVDSIGFRMHYPINNPTIEIRSFSLSIKDPGDQYLEKKPAIDQFGQWALGDYKEKIYSEKQLKTDWAKENLLLKKSSPYPVSKFGGDLARKSKATGFFRTEKINNRWWFVDPEGYLFLSIGANCMTSMSGMAFNVVPGVYTESAPKGFISPQNAMFAKALLYGPWNLYRRFGNNADEAADKMIIDRMNYWGMNTIGNWSSRTLINLNKKPFVIMLNRLGVEDGILGLPDIYEKDFVKKNRDAIKRQTAENCDNPMLIGYFLGNEPAWTHNELRLCDLILKANDDKPLKIALKKYLMDGDTPNRRKAFVYQSFKKYLEITTKALKELDPNHLTLGIRFGSGIPSDEVLQACKDYFDVYSFNHYGLSVNPKNLDYIVGKTNLPLFIGEYHFGTTDRGLGMSLIQVNSQEERGIAYRYYTEQAFAHPAVIGASYFQWNDQEILGRMDGENYNIGLVDVTDRPYPYMVDAIQKVTKNFYAIHAGEKKPYNKLLKRVSIAGKLPDRWE